MKNTTLWVRESIQVTTTEDVQHDCQVLVNGIIWKEGNFDECLEYASNLRRKHQGM